MRGKSIWETTCGCWDYARDIGLVGGERGIMFLDGPDMVGCDTCHRCADWLCDFPLGQGETCDANLCDDHAYPAGHGLHFCPAHAAIAGGMVGTGPVSVVGG